MAPKRHRDRGLLLFTTAFQRSPLLNNKEYGGVVWTFCCALFRPLRSLLLNLPKNQAGLAADDDDENSKSFQWVAFVAKLGFACGWVEHPRTPTSDVQYVQGGAATTGSCVGHTWPEVGWTDSLAPHKLNDWACVPVYHTRRTSHNTQPALYLILSCTLMFVC